MFVSCSRPRYSCIHLSNNKDVLQYRLCKYFVSSMLLSRRSRQRERLSASILSICLLVCLSVCRQNTKKRYWRPIGSRTWAFQRTHYWNPKIQDGWDAPSWKSTWRNFFCWGWSDLDKISQTGAEWHVDCGGWSKSKPNVEFQYGRRFGEFHGMPS